MNLKRILTVGLLALPLSFFAGTAGATAVTGIANIAGNVSVTNTDVNFAPTFTTAGPGATETGDFAGLTGGTIMSLHGGPQTGTVNIPNFMSFVTPTATVWFDLTYIAPGTGNTADCSSSNPGAQCTPVIGGQKSPFTLLQLTSNTVIASLQLNGEAYIQPKSSGFSNAVGIFSTQFVMPGTIPGVLAQLSSGGINGVTYSASFTATPVPEPASMLLVGLGLIGAGLIARRKVSA